MARDNDDIRPLRMRELVVISPTMIDPSLPLETAYDLASAGLDCRHACSTQPIHVVAQVAALAPAGEVVEEDIEDSLVLAK